MIKLQQYGNHENILIAEFGNNDVQFVGASMELGGISNHLIFCNEADLPREMWNIRHGEKVKYDSLKTSNDIPVKFVMVFNSSKSITSLIHSLIEIQEQLQNKENPQEFCNNCGLILDAPFHSNEIPASEKTEFFCNDDCEIEFHRKHN